MAEQIRCVACSCVSVEERPQQRNTSRVSDSISYVYRIVGSASRRVKIVSSVSANEQTANDQKQR